MSSTGPTHGTTDSPVPGSHNSGSGLLTSQATPKRVSTDRFASFAAKTSSLLGSKWAFISAGSIVILWALLGPFFHFSTTWQLAINTTTTVVTFLMVFLIQNTQNRDARAINLKLNELIRATDQAGNHMIDIETLSDRELDQLHSRYERIKDEHSRRKLKISTNSTVNK